MTPGAVSRERLLLFFVPFSVAVLLNALFTWHWGPYDAMRPDGSIYLAIGEAIASGKGFVNPSGIWPDEPTIGRMPLWPSLIALGIKVLPFLERDLLLRVLSAAMNGITAGIGAFLVLRVTRSLLPSMIAGLLLAASPGLVYFGYLGLSEPLFVLLVSAAVLLSMEKTVGHLLGAFLFGLGVLVRSNFILMGIFVPAILAVRVRLDQAAPTRLSRALVWALAFSIPPVAWIGRNYIASGHFPVLSTIRGEAFYGSNNSFVSENLEYWGYWVFPDRIPGETPKRVVASQLSGEIDLDRYYFGKGLSFIKNHYLQMPRLLLGKAVRAFVPVPWKPSIEAYIGSLYRVLLVVLAILGLKAGIREWPQIFTTLLLAMFLTHLITVLVFYGSARFSLTFEIFLVPWASCYAARVLRAHLPKALPRSLRT